MRLCDVDAIIEEHCNGCRKDIQDGCKTDPVCATLMWFQDAPTIDAEVVVRCKDCKRMNDVQFCVAWEGFVREDDFCSYGERKDGDGNEV